MGKPKVSEEQFMRVRDQINRFSVEAFKEVTARLLGQELTLISGGTLIPARIKQVGDLSESSENFPSLMFDVEWEGGHIEFTLAQTGWGGMVPIEREED